jgi:hypothetical protein
MKHPNPKSTGCRFSGDMSTTTVGLLKAASDVLGGPKALAEQLGISEAMLSKYLADNPPLPDALLLRAVDIILTDRQSPIPPDGFPVMANPEAAG